MQWESDAQEWRAAEAQSPENWAEARDRLVAGEVLTDTEEDCKYGQKSKRSGVEGHPQVRNVREADPVRAVKGSPLTVRDRAQKRAHWIRKFCNSLESADSLPLSK